MTPKHAREVTMSSRSSAVTARIRSYTTVRTAHAGEYLVGLCRAWHRTLPESGETPTHIEVPVANGRVALNAGADRLEIGLTAGSRRDTALLEDLVSDCLDRLSSSEDLQYQWNDGPTS